MKLQWFCESDSPKPFDFFGEKLSRCPRRPFLDEPELLTEVFEAYHWYKQGLLPSPGTWYDQTASFVELMSVVDAAVSEGEAYLVKGDDKGA